MYSVLAFSCIDCDIFRVLSGVLYLTILCCFSGAADADVPGDPQAGSDGRDIQSQD